MEPGPTRGMPWLGPGLGTHFWYRYQSKIRGYWEKSEMGAGASKYGTCWMHGIGEGHQAYSCKCKAVCWGVAVVALVSLSIFVKWWHNILLRAWRSQIAFMVRNVIEHLYLFGSLPISSHWMERNHNQSKFLLVVAEKSWRAPTRPLMYVCTL